MLHPICNFSLSTEITKGVFPTCKKRKGCPPWQLSAEKIQHNKKKQTIYYKNALLKVYDIPVMYFPRFFHPDPTVDRKSGFLIPTINYVHAICNLHRRLATMTHREEVKA